MKEKHNEIEFHICFDWARFLKQPSFTKAKSVPNQNNYFAISIEA